jgi:hypothetical protein
MSDTYILEGHKAVAEPDLTKWAKWYEKSYRKVRSNDYRHVRVSTVFLGIDHAYGGGRPLLFETLVFEGSLDGEMDRCTTWEEAEIMHEKMCDLVKKSIGDL